MVVRTRSITSVCGPLRRKSTFSYNAPWSGGDAYQTQPNLSVEVCSFEFQRCMGTFCAVQGLTGHEQVPVSVQASMCPGM